MRTGASLIGLVILLLALPIAAHSVEISHSDWLHHASSDVARDMKAAMHHVDPLIVRYGYGAAFTAVLLEGVGIPTPGQTLLMASALEAAHGRLNIYGVVALTALAAALGNSIGYLIGRLGGSALLRRLHVNERHERKMERLFERYGGMLIMVAFFFDGLRQLNGLVAGALKMHPPVFLVFSIAGAALYATIWGLGVYYVTEHLPQLYATVERINPWIAGAAGAAFIVLLIYLLRGRKNNTADPAGKQAESNQPR